MGELSPEAAKLLDARRSAIAELKDIDGKDREIGDHDVVRLSGARMLVEGLTLRLLAGDDVGPADLQRANEMVDAARLAVRSRSQSITIRFIENAFGVFDCQHCGKRNEIVEGGYVPAGRPKAPVQIEGHAVEVADPAPKALSEKAAQPAAAGPAKGKPEGRMLPRDPSDQSWKADVAPLHGDGGGNPFGAERGPSPQERSNGHALPNPGASLVWSGTSA